MAGGLPTRRGTLLESCETRQDVLRLQSPLPAERASRATESGKPRDAFQATEGRSPIMAYICWDAVPPRGTYGGKGFRL
jgi:hypothetical protein